jgi:tetratricopeptide (TPR) repeat protein
MTKKKLIFYLLILQIFFFSRAFAQSDITDEVDSIIRKGIDLIHREKFDQGIAEFEKIIKNYPEEPIGYFFVAASYQTLIDDYRNEHYKSDFEEYVDTAIAKAERKMNSGHNSAFDHFYLGGAYGYRGIYKSFRGDWWGAFRDARRAKSHLDKALERDTSLYDCYFGLGAYHYWGSIKSRIFWWLPFIGDDREKGIQQYKLAAEKGRYAKDEAKYGLLRVYIEEKEYQKALGLGEELKSINPDDPFILWMKGQAYIGLKNWDEALSTYQRLLEYFKSSTYYDLMSEVECRYWIAYIHYQKNQYQESLKNLGIVLAHKKDVKDNDYSEPVLKGAEELKEKVQEVMQKQKTGSK